MFFSLIPSFEGGQMLGIVTLNLVSVILFEIVHLQANAWRNRKSVQN